MVGTIVTVPRKPIAELHTPEGQRFADNTRHTRHFTKAAEAARARSKHPEPPSDQDLQWETVHVYPPIS